MFKKLVVVVLALTFTISMANAGIGSLFDSGLDGIKQLLKKLDFNPRFIDDTAQTWDEAVQTLNRNGDELLGSLRARHTGDIDFSTFKSIFDDVVRKANIPVPPRVRTMVGINPTSAADIRRLLETKDLRKAGFGATDLTSGVFVDDGAVKTLNACVYLQTHGTPKQKAYMRKVSKILGDDASKDAIWSYAAEASDSDLSSLIKIFDNIIDEEADVAKRLDLFYKKMDDASKNSDSLKKAWSDYNTHCRGTKCLTK